MSSEEHYQTVDELPDRYFNTTVFNNEEPGSFEKLVRNNETDEVLIMSPDGEEQWDEIPAEDFNRDQYIIVPEAALDDPVGFLTAILEREENPLGVTTEVQQDIGRRYAMENTKIVTTD